MNKMSHLGKICKLSHSCSTRYSASDRNFLTKFESLWKETQPSYIPQSRLDRGLKGIVRFLRVTSDYYFKKDLLRRAVMLETVAAVPGIVAGFYHHMRSVRTMKQDHWVKVTMDEAENERMHLMALMDLYEPTALQRTIIGSAQVAFFAFYFTLYSLSGEAAHRFVGYLEEEAVVTYTHFLHMLDDGTIPNTQASSVAREYWGLPEDATLRDLVLVIRADEADHRLVNHAMSDVYAKRSCNYTFDLDIHGPWQADSIRQIEEVIEANKENDLDTDAKVSHKKSNDEPRDLPHFGESDIGDAINSPSL